MFAKIMDWFVCKFDKLGDKWTDRFVFGPGGTVFTLFLLPALVGTPPPLVTSGPTGFFLLLFAVAHWKNNDRKGSFWALACGSVWLALFAKGLFFV